MDLKFRMFDCKFSDDNNKIFIALPFDFIEVYLVNGF